jgi:hypothetical protein
MKLPLKSSRDPSSRTDISSIPSSVYLQQQEPQQQEQQQQERWRRTTTIWLQQLYGGAKLPFFFSFFCWVCFCGSNGGSADTTHRQRQRQTEERKRERRACVHKEKGVRPPAVCAASYNSSGDELTLSNCLHLPLKLQNISVMTILEDRQFVKKCARKKTKKKRRSSGDHLKRDFAS